MNKTNKLVSKVSQEWPGKIGTITVSGDNGDYFSMKNGYYDYMRYMGTLEGTLLAFYMDKPIQKLFENGKPYTGSKHDTLCDDLQIFIVGGDISYNNIMVYEASYYTIHCEQEYFVIQETDLDSPNSTMIAKLPESRFLMLSNGILLECVPDIFQINRLHPFDSGLVSHHSTGGYCNGKFEGDTLAFDAPFSWVLAGDDIFFDNKLNDEVLAAQLHEQEQKQ